MLGQSPFTSMLRPSLVLTALALATSPLFAAPLVLNVWSSQPPGETKTFPAEADETKDTDKLIGGRRIIKLGNVSTPQLTVYRPAKEKDTGASVVILPGGGYNILAYDLEGSEVAEWLNSLGVTGILLKYRVPTHGLQRRRPCGRHGFNEVCRAPVSRRG